MLEQIPIKNKHTIASLLAVFSLILVLTLAFIFPTQFNEIEEKSLDYRFRLQESVPLHPAIINIGIDDKSLDAIGVWPWDRAVHARMITLLDQLRVGTMALDINFPRASAKPDSDQQLVQAIHDAGNVIVSSPFQLIEHPCFTPQEYQEFLHTYPQAEEVLQPSLIHKNGCVCISIGQLSVEQYHAIGEDAYFELVYRDEFVFAGEDDWQRFMTLKENFHYPFVLHEPGRIWYANRTVAPMQAISEAAEGFGHVSLIPDSDGVFRRVPLIIQVQEKFYPALSLATVMHYLKVSADQVEVVPGKHIVLKNPTFPDHPDAPNIVIPVDERLQMRIHYPSSMRFTPFTDVLALEDSPDALQAATSDFEDSICLIGYLATGTGDIGPNPIETNYFLALLHSSAINTILERNFLYDTSLLLNLAITIALAASLVVLSPWLSPLHFTLSAMCIAGGYVGIATWLFLHCGIIVSLINPVLSVFVLTYALIVVYRYATEERERKQLRSAFKTYVSKQMLTKILDNPESLALQGQRKEITIMFSDVRKFSTLSDKIEPELIHRLLNLYFSQMTDIAFNYDGFVDKFIGDGLLCFFGDPIHHPDHALKAVQSAIDMQRAVREMGPDIQEKLGLEPIVIRIGINTGSVIVGNMGSAERMEYTVLGSEVNLAQRLESSATPGQIMISESTYMLVKDNIDAHDMGHIRVKGFERPIQVYEVKLPFE